MQFLRCDVATYCVGQAASMGAVLLSGGTTGKRFLLANSRVLLHQPLITGVLTGPATDLDIEAKEILRLRSRLYNILAEHTGQTPEKIEKDCDRNLWLEAEEAINYGLVDRILQKAPEIVRDKQIKDEK
jgi:ATP-dependent Clp protease protease subunit